MYLYDPIEDWKRKNMSLLCHVGILPLCEIGEGWRNQPGSGRLPKKRYQDPPSSPFSPRPLPWQFDLTFHGRAETRGDGVNGRTSSSLCSGVYNPYVINRQGDAAGQHVAATCGLLVSWQCNPTPIFIETQATIHLQNTLVHFSIRPSCLF